MPRKKVYGKRPTSSAFALSSIFSSRSSPTKHELTVKDDPVDDAAEYLEKLEIRDKHESATLKSRRILGSKDGNIKGRKPTVKTDKKRGVKEKSKEYTQENDILTPETTPSLVDIPPIATGNTQSKISVEGTRPTTPTAETSTDFHINPYIHPILTLSTDPSSPQEFSAWSSTLEPFFRISKIAEASYGEVYRLSLSSPHAQFTASDESVLKILALKPGTTLNNATKRTKAQLKREENMSTISSVASEIKLLKRLTCVPGFTNYRALHLLRGRSSPAFVAAWKEWNESKPPGEKSLFPDPSRKANYSEEQLWAVIEMQDAGTDVEALQSRQDGFVRSVEGAWDVFWQVALAIGKGEEVAEFEHRDLHLGNICVRKAIARRGGKLGFTGLEATIIDYTLSRAEMSDSSGQPGPSHSALSTLTEDDRKEIAYLDLSTPSQESIFKGDSTQDDGYQYEIYRFMRNSVYFSNALHSYEEHLGEAEATGRSWKGFHPQTNLVWLHFVLLKLLEGIEEDFESSASESRSSSDEDDSFRQKEDNKRSESETGKGVLGGILRKVLQLLDFSSIPRDGLASVRDLVAIALSEGWLDEGDVLGSDTASEIMKTVTKKRVGRR